MGIQPPEKTMEDYREAYRAANGCDIDITYKKGWFTIGHWHKKRESEVIHLTNELKYRAERRATNPPA